MIIQLCVTANPVATSQFLAVLMAIRELSAWRCFTAAAVVGESSPSISPTPPLSSALCSRRYPVQRVQVHKPIVGPGGAGEFQRERERDHSLMEHSGMAEGLGGKF